MNRLPVESLVIVASDSRGLRLELAKDAILVDLLQTCRQKLLSLGITCRIHNHLNRWFPGKGYEVLGWKGSLTGYCMKQDIEFSRAPGENPLIPILRATIQLINTITENPVIESPPCPSLPPASSPSPSADSASSTG